MSILLLGVDMPKKGEFSHYRIYDDGDVTVECDGEEVVVGGAVEISLDAKKEELT